MKSDVQCSVMLSRITCLDCLNADPDKTSRGCTSVGLSGATPANFNVQHHTSVSGSARLVQVLANVDLKQQVETGAHS